jgi:hypothetical protein
VTLDSAVNSAIWRGYDGADRPQMLNLTEPKPSRHARFVTAAFLAEPNARSVLVSGSRLATILSRKNGYSVSDGQIEVLRAEPGIIVGPGAGIRAPFGLASTHWKNAEKPGGTPVSCHFGNMSEKSLGQAHRTRLAV